ncbi:MAG: hypothetical protein DIU78_019465 [Pseudomonadota bacterium]
MRAPQTVLGLELRYTLLKLCDARQCVFGGEFQILDQPIVYNVNHAAPACRLVLVGRAE